MAANIIRAEVNLRFKLELSYLLRHHTTKDMKSIKVGGKVQLDHLIKSLSLLFTTNSLYGRSFGLIEINSKSSASQLIELRKTSELSMLAKYLLVAKSESENRTNFASWCVGPRSVYIPMPQPPPLRGMVLVVYRVNTRHLLGQLLAN